MSASPRSPSPPVSPAPFLAGSGGISRPIPALSFALLAGVALLLLWGTGRLLGSGVIDDTYIFLRYARNLAEGRGLRFNPSGPPVEGYTSTAWVLLLSLCYRLGLDAVAAARWLSLICGATAVALVGAPSLPRRWEGPAVSLLMATFPALAFWTGTGMDVAVFLLVTAVIARLLLRAPLAPWRLGIAIGLAAWVRLEAIILWLPWVLLSLPILQQGRLRTRSASRVACGALIVVAPQFVLRALIFHSFLPNTFYAKVSVPFASRFLHGWGYLLESLPAFAGWTLAAMTAAVLAWRRGERESLALLLGALLWTGSAVMAGGDHFALGRFLLPCLPLVALALRRLLESANRRDLRVALLATAGVVLVASAASLKTAGAQSARLEAPLTRAWAKVGLYLGEHEAPSTRIAVVVAGAIPYYSGLPAFDLLGLVTPEVARGGKVYREARPGHQKYNTDALLAFRPDLIVFQSSGVWPVPRMQDPSLIDKKYAYALYDAFMDPRIRSLYQPEATRLPDGTWLEVLRRRG